MTLLGSTFVECPAGVREVGAEESCGPLLGVAATASTDRMPLRLTAAPPPPSGGSPRIAATTAADATADEEATSPSPAMGSVTRP